MNTYTPKQQEYINSVGGNPHASAVTIIGTLEERVAELESQLKIADEAISRQRDAFVKWSELVNAVTTAADWQTVPPMGTTSRELKAWRDGLNEDEKEAMSAAMEIAANMRHGDDEQEQE